MRLLPILATAGAVAALLVTSSSAQAFNTGAHYRATQEGLSAAGLSQGAIDRAHIANYQVDYKSNKPPATQFGKGEVVTRKAAYFHFDDLMTAWDVKRNLAWLDLAGRRMAEQAKEANDPGQALDGLGIALHALQDLYSHSNFADKDWPSLVGERVVTFDDVPEDLWMSPALANVYAPKQTTMLGIFSGNASAGLYGTPAHPEAPSWPEHGPDSVCAVSPECGINHDSVFRRDALTSQEMAILATKQWASKVCSFCEDRWYRSFT